MFWLDTDGPDAAAQSSNFPPDSEFTQLKKTISELKLDLVSSLSRHGFNELSDETLNSGFERFTPGMPIVADTQSLLDCTQSLSFPVN